MDPNLNQVEFEVSGRKFRMANDMTFEQEMYVTSLFMSLGLDEQEPRDALTKGDRAIRASIKDIIIKAYRSGKLFLMVAAVLEEPGVDLDWSESRVQELAKFFASRRNAEDKKILGEVQSNLLMGFWLSAAASFRTSLNSSSLVAAAEAVHASRLDSEGATTSDSGTT